MALLSGTAESLERQRAAIDELSRSSTQSQKMEAMGQLTGGVAHDFSNLLTVILGNAGHLAEKLAARQLYSIAESIATAAERGSDRRAAGARDSRADMPLMLRGIDIGQKIVGMEQLLRRTLGENILSANSGLVKSSSRLAWSRSSWPLRLLNLVLNARERHAVGRRA